MSIPCAREGCASRSKEPHLVGWRISKTADGPKVYCDITCQRLDELEIAATEPYDGHWIHFGLTDDGEVSWRIVCLCADAPGGCPMVNALHQCSCTIWEHYNGPATDLNSGRRVLLSHEEDCWTWRYA